LAHKKTGDNPHLWYNPATVKALATTLAVDLSVADPAHRADYQKAGTAFAASLEPLEAKIADMRKKYAGQPVTASEPVFGYMAELLGLRVHNEKFALSIMNNTEPSASDVAAFENDLKGHKVKVMLYNAQASEPAVQRLVQIAKDEKIPVVGVSETEPANSTYQRWMGSQLDALDQALSSSATQ
jgi:zinc/manganese transport system substrate-binding protein